MSEKTASRLKGVRFSVHEESESAAVITGRN
jgi:hypothetical protein